MNEGQYVTENMLTQLVQDMMQEIYLATAVPEWCEIPDPSEFLTDEDLLIEI